MLRLLDYDAFLNGFPLSGTFGLPGGVLRESEKDELGKKAHVMFRRELGRAWGQMNRIRQAGKD